MNWDKILIQIATADVLQIATSLLQITVGATNCNRFITDCNSYYKLWLILQILAEHLAEFYKHWLLRF